MSNSATPRRRHKRNVRERRARQALKPVDYSKEAAALRAKLEHGAVQTNLAKGFLRNLFGVGGQLKMAHKQRKIDKLLERNRRIQARG